MGPIVQDFLLFCLYYHSFIIVFLNFFILYKLNYQTHKKPPPQQQRNMDTNILDQILRMYIFSVKEDYFNEDQPFYINSYSYRVPDVSRRRSTRW